MAITARSVVARTISRHVDYAEAEAVADRVKGDTGTAEPVLVIEDLDADTTAPNRPARFLVTVGIAERDLTSSTRWEGQYEA